MTHGYRVRGQELWSFIANNTTSTCNKISFFVWDIIGNKMISSFQWCNFLELLKNIGVNLQVEVYHHNANRLFSHHLTVPIHACKNIWSPAPKNTHELQLVQKDLYFKPQNWLSHPWKHRSKNDFNLAIFKKVAVCWKEHNMKKLADKKIPIYLLHCLFSVEIMLSTKYMLLFIQRYSLNTSKDN